MTVVKSMEFKTTSIFTTLLIITAVTVSTQNKQQSGSDIEDTSLYDWVAFSLLDDYVGLLDLIAWNARKLKDHVDNVLAESFVIFSKQIEMVQKAIDLTEKYNRPDCAEGKITDVNNFILKEYSNMTNSCRMMGSQMYAFFAEMHTITEKITEIHRRHLENVTNCDPPQLEDIDKNCLQNIVSECKNETREVRDYIKSIDYNFLEFMDYQEYEINLCLYARASNIRNVTKQTVQEIYCCLGIEESHDIGKKFESPLVDAAMGRITRPFDHLQISAETERRLKQLEKTPAIQSADSTLPPSKYFPAPPPGKPAKQGSLKHHGINYQTPQQPGVQSHSQPGVMQLQTPLHKESRSKPPWRIDPNYTPDYAVKNDENLFEFDESMYKSIPEQNEISPAKQVNDDINNSFKEYEVKKIGKNLHQSL